MRGAVCIIAALTLLVALSACDTPQDFERREKIVSEDNEKFKKNLPKGCKAIYAGDYAVHHAKHSMLIRYPVIIVQCDAKRTLTTTSTYAVGKHTETVSAAIIEN